MSFYMDTSALVPMHVAETGTATIDRFTASITEKVIVSDYAAGEFASVIARLVRTGDVDPDESHDILSDFDAWRATDAHGVATEAADIRLAAAMVRDAALALRMADAVHVAASKRLDATLVTLDRQLARAARTLEIAVSIPD